MTRTIDSLSPCTMELVWLYAYKGLREIYLVVKNDSAQMDREVEFVEPSEWPAKLLTKSFGPVGYRRDN